MIIAGIDEAGYGPLLGPLVVSAAAFEMPGPWNGDERLPCLWKLLNAAVTRNAPPKKGRLVIADSKKVHPLESGDRFMERTVGAVLGNTRPGHNAANGWDLLSALDCRAAMLGEHPWYAAEHVLWPWLCELGDIAVARNMLAAACAKARVRPIYLRAALAPEMEFNRLVGLTGNKAAALVSLTLGHVADARDRYRDDDMCIYVDKQGGRDHYADLLLTYFPDAKLKILRESRPKSAYVLTDERRRVYISFAEKGENACLPTALASMLSKYLRELFMRAFNAWFCRRVENLAPTAGYYMDGVRWLDQVRPHLPRLALREEQLVRCR